jgi:hypothetical protein
MLLQIACSQLKKHSFNLNLATKLLIGSAFFFQTQQKFTWLCRPSIWSVDIEDFLIKKRILKAII